MKKTFKPEKKVVLTIITTWIILITVFCSILVYAGNPIQTLVLPFSAFTLMGVFYATWALSAQISIEKDKLILTYIPPFRKSVHILDIQQVEYRKRVAGGIGSFDIKTKSASTQKKIINVAVNTYGKRQIADLLTSIKLQNSAVNFDNEARKIMQKY